MKDYFKKSSPLLKLKAMHKMKLWPLLLFME